MSPNGHGRFGLQSGRQSFLLNDAEAFFKASLMGLNDDEACRQPDNKQATHGNRKDRLAKERNGPRRTKAKTKTALPRYRTPARPG